MKKLFLALLFLTGLFLPFPLYAETTEIVLTIEDAVSLALRNNRTIRGNYIDRVREKFDLRVSKSRFTPQLSIEAGTSFQRVSEISTTSAFVTPKAAMLFPTGALIDFSWNLSENRQSGGGRDRFAIMDVSINQPLLRGAGVDVNRAPVLQANLSEDINRLRLKRTISETIATVIRSHRELVRAQEEQNLARASLERAQDLLSINKDLIEAGRMASVEIVQTEADIANQSIRVLQSTKSLDSARLNLLEILALDLGTPIRAVENTEPKQLSPRLSQVLPIAFRERPDFLTQTLIVRQRKLGVMVAENEQLWDVSVSVGANMGQRHAFGTGEGRRSVSDVKTGITLSIPINDLTRKQTYIAETTSLENAELALEAITQGVELQVRDTLSDINIQWQQLEASRQSLELAKKAVEIEKEKLLAGRSTNFQVSSLENNLRSAETQKLDSTISYLNALTNLDLQIGMTLETWRISLND